MDKTLTIRIDAEQQQKLGRAAKMLGKTVSELVRDILREALSERSLGSRAGHLKGRISLPSQPRDSWARKIKERNWRE
jgi:metal-responsive CopG/Arc/MetJ family transcriptional regulator